jgi:hypothetical protein
MRFQTWSRMRSHALCSVMFMLLISCPAAAQSIMVVRQAGNDAEHVAAWVGATAGQVGDFDFIAASPGLDAVVKDAPYSAEAVSAMVQMLSDGTRIVRSTTSSLARDWAGRTRREHGLSVIGSLANSPDADMRIVTISDPEAGVSYMLDPQARTARKMTTTRLVVSEGPDRTSRGEPNGPQTLQVESRSAVELPGEGRIAIRARLVDPDSAAEPLGTQFIEGVLVEGTRTTMTIPVSQIGNDRPIEIVSERWFSPDLQVIVMSRQSDPRFGETTYRLTNIMRSDPQSTLFEVPADFEVIDAPGARAIFRDLRVQ